MKKDIWKKEIGTIQDTKNSVQEVMEIRKRLSKEEFDLKEINNF